MKFSTTYRTIIAALFLTVSLTSCLKDKDYEPVQIAGLSLINAVPSSELLDIYADNNRASVTDFGFGTKLNYVNAFAGSRNITVTKKGSNVSLYAERFTLEQQNGYSLFVIDPLTNVKLLMLKDNLTAPSTGKAKIRFVHVAPDAPALNLTLTGNTTNLFAEKAYKGYTDFIEVNATADADFEVKNTAGTVIATLSDAKLEQGKIYTVYAKGLLANTDATKFGLAIFTHQ